VKTIFFKFVILVIPLFVLSCNTSKEEELTFLTFNVWQEGTSVPNGLEKIKNVIMATQPDVVCFTEVRNYNDEDWTTKIANALQDSGLNYYKGYAGGDVSFISKYPLEQGKQLFSNTDKGTIATFDLLVNDLRIVIAGAHLDYTYYACYLPRGYNGGDPDWKMRTSDGLNPEPLTHLDSIRNYNFKSTRDEAIAAFIKTANTENDPIILMGDFNEPSHLDWTERTKTLFDHNGVIMPWTTTKSLSDNGFKDSYRTFYPDEVTHPGFTWPSYVHEKASTSWTPKADERDRLDYIFFKGDQVTVKDVSLVGPRGSYVRNKIDSLHTENEIFMAQSLLWPSDHKAVLARLRFIK